MTVLFNQETAPSNAGPTIEVLDAGGSSISVAYHSEMTVGEVLGAAELRLESDQMVTVGGRMVGQKATVTQGSVLIVGNRISNG